VIVRFASFEPEKQLDMFLEKVAPAYAWSSNKIDR
jgi:hypothetical protein